MLPRGRDAAFAEDVQEVTCWPSSPMLRFTSPLVSGHLLAHTLPTILWRFPRNPWSDIIILCCDTMGFAIFISLLQPPIVNGVLLNSVMNEEKETLGKMKISPCCLNASRFETLVWNGCRMWIDGSILPRRGYVNMIKADYSVHLQIKGAEPISTPTFNTANDQVRIQPESLSRDGRILFDTQRRFKERHFKELFLKAIISLSLWMFSFHLICVVYNEKGRRDNKTVL